MVIRKHAHARAGLVGNPSDGYFGKTISFVIRNFGAEVVLYETPELRIEPNDRDHSVFENINHLARDVRQFGYYGGIRLLKATVKRFADYCAKEGIPLHDRNFTLRYESNVPPQVGMAGSSAIICAGLRALMDFYQVEVPLHIQPNLVLSVENDELGIPAGLQDRVIQVYEGVVFMDFNRGLMEERGYGNYEVIDPSLLPPLYVAYTRQLSEGTEVFHNDIRSRWNRGEREIVSAMYHWAGLAERVKEMLLSGRGRDIGPLLNENFDLRRRLYKISKGNIDMVEAARSVGASAKFTGSGGAIVGTYEDEAMYKKLEAAFGELGVAVIKPQIMRA
ncbi:glucuronokinase [Roseimicrobium gellanilyticum]|uniref:Glucuronokinase n=1 Tax=Roseimicrobium gellanilyticum TaxID=748857 RepID=A0A366HNF5_9BACT|nr:GHMP kinase [Roseimicrobium gellanilyticum]RBP45025.1 glucuronokinase [Roseimicrobium gellanilyticum]